jgi:hypothetical protein
VTPANFDRLRSRNFGIRELQNPHDVAWYGREIAAYSACDAAVVSARARASAGLEPAVDRLLAIYAAAMASRREPGGVSEAAARHLVRIARPLKDAYNDSVLARNLARDLELARAERDAEILARSQDAARARQDAHGRARAVEGLQNRLNTLERELAAARDRADCLEADVAAFRSLSAVRLRDAMLRVPFVGSILHAGARRCAHAVDRLRLGAR